MWEEIEELLNETYKTSHIINKRVLHKMYIEWEMTLKDVGYVLNCDAGKVYRDLKIHEIPIRKVGTRGKTYSPLPKFDLGWGYGKHPLLLRQPRLINSAGYVQLYMPGHPLADKNGYVYEHRYVAESMLGRDLLPTEVVHHRDGNKQNNLPHNLEVMTTNEHSALGYSLMNKFKAPKSSDPRLEQEWLKVVGEVYSLFCRKNSDYGPNNIAGLGIEGVVVRLFDKFMRLKTLTFNTPESVVEDETIEDTVLDIIDYGVIYILVKRGLWPEYVEPDFSEWDDLEAFRELVKEKQVYDKDRPIYTNEGLEKLRVKMENGDKQ